MKKLAVILGMVVAVVGFMTLSAQADLIGDIAFGGGVNYNTTAFVSFSPTSVIYADGVLGPVSSDTKATGVAISSFSYNAPSVKPLWTVDYGNHEYAFYATTVTGGFNSANDSVDVGGVGYLTIDNTTVYSGDWTITASNNYKMAFELTADVVPEPATLLLLGAGLTGLGLYRSRRKKA
jgi:hypothetical protein